MDLPASLRPLLADPGRSAVLTDFDGTLAAIVDDPSQAAPLPGVVEVLTRLTRHFALAGVVSGRPVAYLVDRLGPELWLSGLYGLERWRQGSRVEVPGAEEWRPVLDDVVARAESELGPMVESKGLSVTLHFRTHPERREEVGAWAEAEAKRSGLALREARASVELHPPVDTDKGTEVEAAGEGMVAVCFLGDDLGDLAAFAALDRLAGTGVHAVRVAVSSEESPPELLERADLAVDGPDGALALLESLASEASVSDGSPD